MRACLFCRIAGGDVPATVVAETERALAFRDINPAAPVHVLVMPRDHFDSAATLTDAGLWAELIALAQRIAADEGLGSGWRLVTNVGLDGGQSVSHLHLHLLGGRRMGWPPG